MEPTRGLVITRAEAALALDVMTEMRARQQGWVNVVPEIPDDVRVPSTPGVLAVFSKRGPAVPMGTWTAPTVAGSRREPAQVGIQHGIAARAVERLGRTTVAVPSDWRVVQDHPRRGLVAIPPVDGVDAEVLDWILAALDELCRVPTTGRFLAYVYEPGRA